MIFGSRIEISGTLKAKSHLHIGCADRKTRLDGDGTPREYAALARWNDGQPFIPASSLKGVLRAALAQAGEDFDDLFGEASEHEAGRGKAAKLWFDHAIMKCGTEDAELEHLSDQPPSNGVFVTKRVALDPTTGAAWEHKLFERELVAKGATFSFHATWFGGKGNIEKLIPVLSILGQGIQLGAATSKGNGLVKLKLKKLSLKLFEPTEDGSLKETDLPTDGLRKKTEAYTPTATDQARIITLRLTALGPFLSVRKTGGDTSNNVLLPLRDSQGPTLWQTSLAGALRSRARWLVARNAEDQDHHDRPDQKRQPEERRDDNSLSDVERLFGITGRRAKLRITKLKCTNPGIPISLTSNSLDRLTGATRAGALFTRRAYWKPEFEATLVATGEHDLLNKLLDDLESEPLELGHGASVGFGWFQVEQV